MRETYNNLIITNNVSEYLAGRHPGLVGTFKNPFECLSKTTKDVKLRNIQFKMLHNIYPTMKHLHKWGIKPTQNCAKCAVSETLEHAIYTCPVAKDAIRKFEYFMLSKLEVSLSLSFNDVIFGTWSNLCRNMSLNSKQRAVIDTCLILLKQMLILQREEKRDVDEQSLERVLVDYAKREVYNNRVYKKTSFNNYWYEIMR